MENFGYKFRDYRQKRNLSIEEVSEKTKIRKHIVQAMEEGNLSVLPPVYLTYFVKTYAGFLKLPDNDINNILASISGSPDNRSNNKPQAVAFPVDKVSDSQHFAITTENNEIVKPLIEKKHQKSYLSRKKPVRISQANIVSYLIYSALGLAVVSLIYFAFFSNGTSNLSNFAPEESGSSDTADSIVIGAEASNVSASSGDLAQTDSLVLEAKGIDTAWLRIVVDGVQSEQLVFYPDVEKRWSARHYVMLSLGNEGAIEFKRNGKLLKPFGKKRSVIRNIKITANDVTVSSSPWNNKENTLVSTTSSPSSSSPNGANIPAKKTAIKKHKKKIEKAEAPRLLEPSAIQNSYTPFGDRKIKR
jgi:cytoskeletal protein RodZ